MLKPANQAPAKAKKPRISQAIAGLMLAVSFIGIGDDLHTDLLIRGMAATIAVLLFYFPIRKHHHDWLDERPKPFPRHAVPAENAKGLQRRAGDARFDVRQAKLFALAVTSPRTMRQRIVDSYTPGRRVLAQSVVIEAQLPSRPKSGESSESTTDVTAPIYFPVIIPHKGKLLDNFKLTDSAGTVVSILSYREYLELSAGVLRALLQPIAGGTAGTSRENVRAAERTAIEQMMRRRDGATVLHPGEDPGWAVIKRLPATGQVAIDLRDLASSFAQALTDSYCIVAVISPDHTGRFLLQYEQDLIPDLDLSDKRNPAVATFMSRVRIALGARPVSLTIGVENASICQSYHLQVKVSDDLFMSSQSPLDFDKLINSKAPSAPTLPHLRFRGRLGQPYAHFYCRYLPTPPSDARPRIKFTFIEVPPGSVIRASVASIAALAMIWLVGVVNSMNTAPDTDAPAYLLTFPAAAAAWMGFDAAPRRLLEGTLRARLALLATATLSIFASGLFLAHKAIESIDWPRVPFGVSIAGVTDLWWAILLSAAFINTLNVCYRYYVHTLHFAYYSAREQDGNDFKQHA